MLAQLQPPRKKTYRVSGNLIAPAAIAPFITIVGAAGRVLRVSRIKIHGPTLTALQYLRITVTKHSTAWTGGTPVAGTKAPLDSTSPASLATINTYAGGGPSGGGALVGRIAERTVLGQSSTPAAGAPLDEGDFDWTAGEISTEYPTLRGTGESLAVSFAVAPVSAVTLSYTIEYSEDGN